MYSLPFEPRKVRATERVLMSIYTAASLGLKGDSLALAAGLLPSEYRTLTELDDYAKLAAQKGRADGEFEHATKLADASRAGDAKASLAILQHVYGWTAKQEISMSIQSVSITQALEDAHSRVRTINQEKANVRTDIVAGHLHERSRVHTRERGDQDAGGRAPALVDVAGDETSDSRRIVRPER